MEEGPVPNSRSSKYVDVALCMHIGPSVSLLLRPPKRNRSGQWRAVHLNETARYQMEGGWTSRSVPAGNNRSVRTKQRIWGPRLRSVLGIHLIYLVHALRPLTDAKRARVPTQAHTITYKSLGEKECALHGQIRPRAFI